MRRVIHLLTPAVEQIEELLASPTVHRVKGNKPADLHNSSATSQLPIRHSAVIRQWRKNVNSIGQ